jgi:hypothetical protein
VIPLALEIDAQQIEISGPSHPSFFGPILDDTGREIFNQLPFYLKAVIPAIHQEFSQEMSLEHPKYCNRARAITHQDAPLPTNEAQPLCARSVVSKNL